MSFFVSFFNLSYAAQNYIFPTQRNDELIYIDFPIFKAQ